MRCYFMRDGHIFSVDVLRQGMTDTDADAVKAGASLLRKRIAEKQVLDGFEVWDCARFIYRFPASGNGTGNSRTPTSAVGRSEPG